MKFLRRTAHVVSIVTLLVSSAYAQSRPKNQQKAGQGKNQAESIQRGTETAPVFIKPLPIPPTEEETAEKAAERERQRNAAAWTFRFALATVLVGLLQAFIYWKQARSLRDTIAKMDEVSNAQHLDMVGYIAEAKRQATAVEGIVTSMNQNVVLLQDALRVNRDIALMQKRAVILQHRAHLDIADFRIYRTSDKYPSAGFSEREVTVSFVVENKGQTAARLHTIKERVASIGYSKEREMDLIVERWKPDTRMFNFTVTEEIEHALLDSQFVVELEVDYSDGFERRIKRCCRTTLTLMIAFTLEQAFKNPNGPSDWFVSGGAALNGEVVVASLPDPSAHSDSQTPGQDQQ